MKAQYQPLPILEVSVGTVIVRALVDTSCTATLLNPKLVSEWSRSVTVKAVDGKEVKFKGTQQVEIKVCEVRKKT